MLLRVTVYPAIFEESTVVGIRSTSIAGLSGHDGVTT
jgi:hypothetical protein